MIETLRAGHGDNCAWCQGEANSERLGKLGTAVRVPFWLAQLAGDLIALLWEAIPRRRRR